MLIKYYLSDKIKAPFKNFALGLGIAWASLGHNLNILKPVHNNDANTISISF